MLHRFRIGSLLILRVKYQYSTTDSELLKKKFQLRATISCSYIRDLLQLIIWANHECLLMVGLDNLSRNEF